VSRTYLVRIEGTRSGVGSKEPAEGLAVLDRRTIDGRVEAFQVGLVADVEQSEAEEGAGEQGYDYERQRAPSHSPAVPGEYVAEEVLDVLVQGAHRDDVTATSRQMRVAGDRSNDQERSADYDRTNRGNLSRWMSAYGDVTVESRLACNPSPGLAQRSADPFAWHDPFVVTRCLAVVHTAAESRETHQLIT